MLAERADVRAGRRSATLGLHDAVLRLFDSPSDAARAYAADYARTHARDLPVAELVRLANNAQRGGPQAGRATCSASATRARTSAWTRGASCWRREHGHKLAADGAHASTSAPKELTPEWFPDRLLSPSDAGVRVRHGSCCRRSTRRRSSARRSSSALLDAARPRGRRRSRGASSTFAAGELARFDLNALDRGLPPLAGPVPRRRGGTSSGWVDEGQLKPQALGVGLPQDAGLPPGLGGRPVAGGVPGRDRRRGRRTWRSTRAAGRQVLGWLGDVRKFSPGRARLRLADAAGGPDASRCTTTSPSSTMIRRRSRPADFAPQDSRADAPAGGSGRTVDLQKASLPVHRQAGDDDPQGGRGEGEGARTAPSPGR